MSRRAIRDDVKQYVRSQVALSAAGDEEAIVSDMTPAEKRCFRRALRRHARRFAVRHPLTNARYYRDEARIRYRLWRE